MNTDVDRWTEGDDGRQRHTHTDTQW